MDVPGYALANIRKQSRKGTRRGHAAYSMRTEPFVVTVPAGLHYPPCFVPPHDVPVFMGGGPCFWR